ncbi:MAG: hypothetical protein ACRDT2_09815 [Natronosporangium sp.]
MASDWISVGAEVFSAVGTVGAFLLGFLLLRREHRREADRAEDDRRTQASQISAPELGLPVHDAHPTRKIRASTGRQGVTRASDDARRRPPLTIDDQGIPPAHRHD